MLKYVIFVLAYLAGAIPFAYFAGTVKQVDVRKGGSGNIGATNAFRLLGPKLGLAVLAGDSLKGALAAWSCYYFWGPWGGLVGGMLAIAGHSWNPFFGFRPTGKGAATGLGILIALMPKIALIVTSVFVLVVATTRFVSAGSMAGAMMTMASSLLFPLPLPYRLFSLVVASLVLLRHRANLKRIIMGIEPRFRVKPK